MPVSEFASFQRNMSRPSLKEDPITVDDIKAYLATTDDFRLEIEVFRMCMEAGFAATHGGSYRDPVTGQNRQYDVRAHYADEFKHIRLAIECKNLGSHFPLLISTVPRRPSESQTHFLVSAKGSGGGRYSLWPVKTGLFQWGEPVGKATARVGVKTKSDDRFIANDSDVYEKWAQAIASAHDLVGDTLNDWKTSKTQWAVGIALPVLVIGDDALWIANYDDSGNLVGDPSKVNEAMLYLNSVVGASDIQYPLSHLLVFTLTGFQAFLNRFKNHGMVRDALLIDYSEARDYVTATFGDLLKQ
ncbi:MAG: hypothetical protein IAE94_05225 [Chthoniobacterales bacterium]|nr:hypothetical protein [Chthoniobacterales bacterium]